ncbi:hypothetical protein N9E90_00525 [Akkermansiaceae bacterium]|nr:hypothetical protein [Akkermansiaceae bacterium]
MKSSQRTVTTTYGKKIIGADGGELLFIDAMPASSDMPILMASLGRPPIQRPAIARTAHATEKVELHFSTAGRAVKKSISSVFKGPDAAKRIWFWAAVSSPEKPEFIREHCLEGLERADPGLYGLCKGWAERLVKEEGEVREPYESEIYDQLLKLAGPQLVKSCQRGTLIQHGELVSHLSKNYRKSTNEEKDLLLVIGDIATQKWDVPFQREVREEWIELRYGRDDDAFRRTRDAVGFKWLPVSTRGKQRI